MYAALALLMPMGIIYKSSLQLYSSRNQIVATPILVLTFPWIDFKASVYLHFIGNMSEGPQKQLKI